MACSNNCDVKGRLGVCSHFILNVYALTYTHGQDTQFVHKCRLSLGHYHYQMDELLRVEKEGVAKEEVAVLCAGWWVVGGDGESGASKCGCAVCRVVGGEGE